MVGVAVKLHLAPCLELLLTLTGRQDSSPLPQECSLLPVGSCASPPASVCQQRGVHSKPRPAHSCALCSPCIGGAGLGHCAPLVADPQLLSTGGCIHVVDKALISSSACPSIPTPQPSAVWLLPEEPQLILPTLEHC